VAGRYCSTSGSGRVHSLSGTRTRHASAPDASACEAADGSSHSHPDTCAPRRARPHAVADLHPDRDPVTLAYAPDASVMPIRASLRSIRLLTTATGKHATPSGGSRTEIRRWVYIGGVASHTMPSTPRHPHPRLQHHSPRTRHVSYRCDSPDEDIPRHLRVRLIPVRRHNARAAASDRVQLLLLFANRLAPR
jgi:hypothetical protein